MSHEPTESELEAYLDEALDPDHAMVLEKLLREQPDLIGKLSSINARRDAGLHTLGEIWRRFEIGVPQREVLNAYLDESLDAELTEYITFRLEVLKCPFTIANVQDLQAERDGASEEAKSRREKFFRLGKRLNDDDEADE